MSIFTKEDLDYTKKVDLYEFVTVNNLCNYRIEGDSIRILDTNGKGMAITIQRGKSYYKDWGSGEAHDPVRFMTEVLGYEFIDAVRALLGFTHLDVSKAKDIEKKEKEEKELVFPEKSEASPRRLYAYLNQTRCIDGKIIEKLLKLGYIYQSKEESDIIFINKDKTCYEIRSTRSTGYQKKRCYPKNENDFWYFNFGNSTDVYVCEGAIDAISLCEMQKKPGVYVSLHSVSNTNKILKRLRRDYPDSTIYLCTDNDAKGENAAIYNIGLYDVRLTPKRKDWNEDLKIYKFREMGSEVNEV